MGDGLPPLEFTECLSDSPHFRANLHKHEQELERTNQHIKRIIKEVKDLIAASKQLSNAQKSFANCLKGFTFECIGGTQTDDETVICKSLQVFGDLINSVEEERKRMLDNAIEQVVKPLEDFRKRYIGGVKNERKKFEKQTAKFCQNQERYLNLTTKKPISLQEADASVGMAEHHFYVASMEYVYLIQEVHERKKFEFVETLLTFMISLLTFYHQGYEVANDSQPYMRDLMMKIQKTRTNFNDFSQQLRKRMSEVQKLDKPINPKDCKEGYLFLLEKKAFGATWTKQYCEYNRKTKKFSMLPYNQLTTKSPPAPDVDTLVSCVRRSSISIEKRFCFDIQLENKPTTYTLQALSEQDRKSWMDSMDGKEPTYQAPVTGTKTTNSANVSTLDEVGISFVQKCIEVLEKRGLEDQGLYRIAGVSSRTSKFMSVFLDKRKLEKGSMEDPEWETKTITSALKTYLRNLPGPLLTFPLYNKFISAVKLDKARRIHEIHHLLYKIPPNNFNVLKMVIKHLTKVAEKCDKNLMTISNLAVCFGPTLLRSEEETVATIMELKFCNIVVEILIEHYDTLFLKEPAVNGVSHEYKEDLVVPNVRGSNNGLSNGPSTSAVNSYLMNGDYFARNHSNQRTGWPDKHYNVTVSTYIEPVNPGNLYNPKDLMNRSTPSFNISQNNSPSKFIMQNPHYYSPISHSESDIADDRVGYGNKTFEPDSNSSSSNESVALTSEESNSYSREIPKKNQRTYPPQTIKYNLPGNIRVRTLFACVGENDGELSFEPNQIITNVRPSPEPGWLEGSLNGKTGLIPENYVELLP